MNDLDKLKSLLFGDEKQALDSITQRVERPEARAVDVADILAESIHLSHEQGSELAQSMKGPVGECLQQAFHEDPQTYGDALYPVMGPAIRKSIFEALRGLAQQINEAVEQSLTPRGIRWRLQAWRAGIPFGEFLLQKTLLYRVEQAYLISRENGLLISHVHHDAAKIKDSDAVSAMFTAIQDFVKESFSPDRTGRLESADMGDFTLWAVHGPHALLVCVIRGVPPKALRGELSGILERIHFRYGDPIRSYAGDTSSVSGIEQELEACLHFEARQTETAKGHLTSGPLLIMLGIGAAALAYWAYAEWVEAKRITELRDALNATPGIYVGEVDEDRGRILVSGLRDPLSENVDDIAERVGLTVDDIDWDLGSYQSLDPEIIVGRAEQMFGTPGDVSYEVEVSTLIISGPAAIEWQDLVNRSATALVGIDDVQFRMSSEDRVAVVRQWLAPPSSVDVASGGTGIVLSGSAPGEWLESTAERLGAASVDWPIDIRAVVSSERLQLDADVRSLSGTEFFFVDGTRLAEGQADALQEFSSRISSAAGRADAENLDLVLELAGFTDGVGDEATNRRLAQRRTETVADALITAGYDGPPIRQVQRTTDDVDAGVNPVLRRVSTELTLVERTAPQ